MNLSKIIFVNILLIIGLVLSSCVSTKSMLDGNEVYTYDCVDRIVVKPIDNLSIDVVLNKEFLLEKYTVSDLMLANSFGLIPDLEAYENLRKKIASKGEVSNDLLAYIKYSQKINETADLAKLEIQSLEDLISCSALQLHKYKSKLASKNNKSQNILSNRAVFFGAITTVMTAGILLSGDEDLKGGDTFDWMAVGAGVATLYLARKSTKVDHGIELVIYNNFIEAILLEDNKSQLFSPSIWYLINNEQLFKEGSLRSQIINEWKKSDDMLANKSYSNTIDLLISKEGLYTEETLQLRIDMLDAMLNQLNKINSALLIFNSKK